MSQDKKIEIKELSDYQEEEESQDYLDDDFDISESSVEPQKDFDDRILSKLKKNKYFKKGFDINNFNFESIKIDFDNKNKNKKKKIKKQKNSHSEQITFIHDLQD